MDPLTALVLSFALGCAVTALVWLLYLPVNSHTRPPTWEERYSGRLMPRPPDGVDPFGRRISVVQNPPDEPDEEEGA